MQPPRQSAHNFTGEGFSGEKVLAIIAAISTIVSVVLLIDLTLLQRKQVKLELSIKEEQDKEAASKKA